METTNIVLQILCILGGFVSQMLIGDRNKICFIIGIINNTFWLIFFIHNGTYLMLLTVGMYYYTNIRGFILWGKCKSEIDI